MPTTCRPQVSRIVQLPGEATRWDPKVRIQGVPESPLCFIWFSSSAPKPLEMAVQHPFFNGGVFCLAFFCIFVFFFGFWLLAFGFWLLRCLASGLYLLHLGELKSVFCMNCGARISLVWLLWLVWLLGFCGFCGLLVASWISACVASWLLWLLWLLRLFVTSWSLRALVAAWLLWLVWLMFFRGFLVFYGFRGFDGFCGFCSLCGLCGFLASWLLHPCGSKTIANLIPSPSVSHTTYTHNSLTHNLRHLAASDFTLCGRRGTYGAGLALVARLVLVGAVAVYVAGVAFGSTDADSVWQAWHLATSTFTLCGRRGAWRHRLFVWQVYSIWKHRRPFCVKAWRFATSTFILCGRHGTWRNCLGATVLAQLSLATHATQQFHTQLFHIQLSHT